MKLFLVSCMIGVAVGFTSCSSDEAKGNIPEGKGTVSLGMTTGVDFGSPNSRAVNMSDYQNADNYTVQILKSDGTTTVQEFTYANKPSTLTLDNGTYVMKAFYGEEKTSSRDIFRVEGSTTFTVQSDEQTVAVTCAPTCAKATVVFDESMATYFSDYSVAFETAALSDIGASVVWKKDDTEPWFLKVDKNGESVKATITFTRRAEYGTGVASASVEKSYTLSPNKAWTLKIAPSYDSGKLGISVTIDESTNDKNVDIIVPSEWI